MTIQDRETGTVRDETFGERAVGVSFNPSGDGLVYDLKETAAKFIDLCNDIRLSASDPDVVRMTSIAITGAQTAQMWAVKAATWK